jgi:hypothetical protein
MKKTEVLQADPKAGASFQIQAGQVHRIVVVDGAPYIRHLNAEVLIRHGNKVNAAKLAQPVGRSFRPTAQIL